MKKNQQVIIIGAGVAGLAIAIRLRIKGYEVSVYEKNPYPGGKLSEIREEGFRFDAGPSLFTLPDLVKELFVLAGKNPGDHFAYDALPVITKYFYPDGSLITAWSDPEVFAEELAQKTGENKFRVLRALKKSEVLYRITHHVFLERSLHKLSTYLRWDTLFSALQLHRLDAFRTMARANQQQFRDPRVTQLFNRYATYNGSDPFQAPATLNIIPHLEHNLGAFFPKEGMYSITTRLFQLAQELGVEFHFGAAVDKIRVENKRVKGINLNGREIPADIVVSNADIVPTYRHLLSDIAPPEKILNQPRSSSALIFYWGIKKQFLPLDLHNIFFSENYEEEFRKIWREKTVYHDPTVYVYVSSKQKPDDAPPGCENWFVMINVPANTGQDWDVLIQRARKDILRKLEKMLGESVEEHIQTEQILEPRTIDSLTSSFQGALYGNSSNNKFAAFLRHPNFHPHIKGLYFCGGSVHPGGGIPLCLLSAKIVDQLIG
ncbi:MAG: 1-hydroxycarotenoid 3,4-desaturase CrtD [Bacteroidia bacterium]|nr:1-hydroxycarotenoid 3,4-desaturase CrtD [Bacteroidia bacterium]